MAKYGYICFIRFTHDYLTNQDLWPAFQDKMAKLAEKHGFKMHIWGSPWGTDEHGVMVCESDKPLSDWSQYIGEILPEGNIATTRTILVNIS